MCECVCVNMYVYVNVCTCVCVHNVIPVARLSFEVENQLGTIVHGEQISANFE